MNETLAKGSSFPRKRRALRGKSRVYLAVKFTSDSQLSNPLPSPAGGKKPISLGQVGLIFVKFAHDNPARLNEKAATLVIESMTTAYPCKTLGEAWSQGIP